MSHLSVRGGTAAAVAIVILAATAASTHPSTPPASHTPATVPAALAAPVPAQPLLLVGHLPTRAAVVSAPQLHHPQAGASALPDTLAAPPTTAPARTRPRRTTAAASATADRTPRTAERATRSARHERTESTTQPPIAAAGGMAAIVTAYARRAIGAPYVFGADGPYAYDCSGLVKAAYAAAGVTLPHLAAALAHVGRPVTGEIQPGDILIFYGGGHAAIALGGGMMIHSPHPGSHVMVVPMIGRPSAVRRLT